MQRNHLIKFFFLALLAVANIHCTKQAGDITGPAGPAGQAGANGTNVKSSPVNGYIALFDQYNNPFPSSGGVNISVLNGDSLLKTTTDSTGKFAFPPLPSGAYSLHVTKPGFDSLEIFFRHSGGDEAKFLGSTEMVQTQSTKITSQSPVLLAYPPSGTSLNLTTYFSGPPLSISTQRSFYFYFSHSKDLTSLNYEYMTGTGGPTGNNQITDLIPLSSLSSSGKSYNPGDTVYVKTFIAAPFDAQTTWFDYAANRSVPYPYYGDSTVTWFIYQP